MILRHPRTGITLLLLALLLGTMLGILQPSLAVQMKPLSDLFISIIGLCAPMVMFVLICSSVATLNNRSTATRLVFKAAGYWQLMSLLSLLAGFWVALIMHPGDDSYPMGNDWHMPQTAAGGPLFSRIPGLLLDLLEQSLILKVLLLAIICGLLLGRGGTLGQSVARHLDQTADLMLRIMQVIVRLAPLAAFGAIAFIIGQYGPKAALPLAKFVVVVHAACLVYLLLVPAIALRLAGCRLWGLVGYIKEELLLVAATSSSVAALPRLIEKLEAAGCDSQTVRLTLTTGYTFNLNGSNVYLAVAIVFLAQSMQVELDGMLLGGILLISLLTSLGSTSVAGSAFITLTVTLSILNIVSLESIGILIGVERLMKCRSLTNVLGNCVACVIIACWHGKVDRQRLRQVLG